MKKTFHEILAEKNDEFKYQVRSTVDIHNPEYFERVKMTLMPYRIKDISIDSFRPLSKDNKTFPDQPNHATYSVRVVTGLPVDTKKVLQTMAMICHIHISHLHMTPEDDVESVLTGKPIEVDKTTSQALVGHQRIGEFMKELQRDRKDREKKFITREVYESFFTTHRALENVLKKPIRNGYYMVEMCREPDGQNVMRAEGPFEARPDGNQYRDSFGVKSASILSESTAGGMYGVQAIVELAPAQNVDETMFEVAVSDMNSGRRYTAMVRANTPEIAREAAVSQVAEAHRLDPSGLTAMAPRPANAAPQMWTEAEMPMQPGAPAQPVLPPEKVLRALQHAFTVYDQRLSRGKSYNQYALAKYLEIADDISQAVAQGKPLRQAITGRLNDRLLDVALRAVGEPPATRDEIRGVGQYLPR